MKFRAYKLKYQLHSGNSGKTNEPWSANTGCSQQSEDVEISCFLLSKPTTLSSSMAQTCQLKLDHYLNSQIVPDILSFLDEFEDLDWVRPQQLIHLVEMIAKQHRDSLKQRILGLVGIITSKRYVLSRQIIKLIFSCCGRIGQNDGVFVLSQIDHQLEDSITLFETTSSLQMYHQSQFLPLILYSHSHQLLHWGLINECWELLRTKLKVIVSQELRDEWEKTAQKICDLLLRHMIEGNQSELLEQVLNEGVSQLHPTDIFFNKLIDYAFKNKNVRFAELIFNYMRDKAQIQPTIVTINTLIDQYFKNNMKDKAWKVFETLKQSQIKPDNFTYTTLINGLKNNRDGLDLRLAFQLFEEYKQFNNPDQIIYNCLLDACINAGDLSKAFLLLQEMKNTKSIQLDEITYNTLIKGCGRKKKLNEAIQLFEEMKSLGIKPNRISFNSLLDSCVKCNRMNIAWRYFEEMRKQYGIFPDNFTYSILVNGIKTNHSNRDELLRAITLLEQIQETGQFKPDEILYNSLIDACVKFNEIQKALQLFKEMKQKQIEPSSVTYGILIKAYGKMNDLNGAFSTFQEMKNKNVQINDVTYGCLVDACVRNDRLDRGLWIIEEMKRDKIQVNTVLYTTIIKGFCKLNQTDEAMKYFTMMKQDSKTYPNLITYNSLLDGLVKNNQMNEADRLFHELLKTSIKPDLITFSTLLKGYCKKGNMKKVNEAVSEMIRSQTMPDESLLQLIIDCCLHQQHYDVGVQIYDQFCHHIPQSTQLLTQALRLHALDNELRQALPLLDRLLSLMQDRNLQTQQIEQCINQCLNSKLDEQSLSVLSRIVCVALDMDMNIYPLEALIIPENSELLELLNRSNRWPCNQLQKILPELDFETQQICKAYIKKNIKNDMKEPLNEQFGKVFMNCTNNENKENMKKPRNEMYKSNKRKAN
ncbi:hypothetical protein pb186bvf_011083 [Paramecium bursaria]